MIAKGIYTFRIYSTEMKWTMERLTESFIRLRRDMAWLQYSITNDRKPLEKLEF